MRVLDRRRRERARLRSQLNGSMEVAGEFASLAAARASEIDADAILIAARQTSTRSAVDDDERSTSR